MTSHNGGAPPHKVPIDWWGLFRPWGGVIGSSNASATKGKSWKTVNKQLTMTSNTFCSHLFIRVCCMVSSLVLFLLFFISHMVSSMNSICKDCQGNNCKEAYKNQRSFWIKFYTKHTLLLFIFDSPSPEAAFNSFTLFCTVWIKSFMAAGSSRLSFIPQPVQFTAHVSHDWLVCNPHYLLYSYMLVVELHAGLRAWCAK